MKYFKALFLFAIIHTYSSAQIVVQVYDGDTYKILKDGKFEVIRLANIDAPELKQYYGSVVRREVALLILARIITIESYGKDRYGRVIANVKIDNMSLDSFLIAKGYAWHYTTYSHHQYLSTYEALAKKSQCGMWQCAYNIPPWIWRKLNSQQKRLKEMCR